MQKEDPLQGDLPPLQRQLEGSWWEAEGTKLLVPSQPSRRGKAGKRENFLLQGAFLPLTR